MKLHFMKDDALAYFKGNVENNLEHYLDKDNTWLYEKYAEYKGEGASPFGEFKFEVPDFQLKMLDETVENSDYWNTQILYTALKDISDTQASDERFWAGLAHSELWSYMQDRCRLEKDTIKSNKIFTNYFFNYTKRRSLFVHPLARMWWAGRLTYDLTEKEHFNALEYMKFDFSTKVLQLFSSTFTGNPKITRAILKAVVFIESKGIEVKRNAFLEILRYVNYLGGIIILDYLSEDELKNKIINHYAEINNIDFQTSLEEDFSNKEKELLTV